jgi:hypothetical protein
LGIVRRVVGVLLVTVLVPGLVACAKKRPEGSPAQAAAWFKAVATQKPSPVSTTTTTRPRATTTIPPTTTTVPPLARLALSRAFLEAAEARRLADQRCQQLSGGKRRHCAKFATASATTTTSVEFKAKALDNLESPRTGGRSSERS